MWEGPFNTTPFREKPKPSKLLYGLLIAVAVGIIALVLSGCNESKTTAVDYVPVNIRVERMTAIDSPLDSVARIRMGERNGGAGTGFLLRSGVLVTAKHCVMGVDKFFIQYRDGTEEITTQKDVVVDKNYDIAYIKVNKTTCEDLKVSPINNYIGREIYIAGMPWKYPFIWVSRGIVGSELTSVNIAGWLWHGARICDISAMRGCSGAPVFDSEDEVVGILVGGWETMTVIIDVEVIRNFVKDNIDGEENTITETTREVQEDVQTGDLTPRPPSVPTLPEDSREAKCSLLPCDTDECWRWGSVRALEYETSMLSLSHELVAQESNRVK